MYSKISGSSYRISNIIDKFKNCEFQVLFLNAAHFGAGLNLQFTDNIMIYHRMSTDLEKQVIGRAQRMGRMVPLTINYLCFENEYPSSVKLTDAAIETSSTEEEAQDTQPGTTQLANHGTETVVNSVSPTSVIS